MKEAKLIHKLPAVQGSYREDALLAKTTWFQVGGPAEILFRPQDPNDLAYFIKNKSPDIPYQVIGVGSNLLVKDGGIDGVIIKLGREFAHITYDDELLIAGAAALDFNVATYAKELSLSGLEFLVGIPGTIGGGIAMNAGCYGSDFSSVIEYITCIDEFGDIHQLSRNEIGFYYRGNSLPSDWIFIEAAFKLKEEEQSVIENKMMEIQKMRTESQPIKSMTGGSTFKNPEGKKAWELIDAIGFRGKTFGGASVSEKHCNFLINNGEATASDLITLGENIKQEVLNKFNIELEWEIQIIGKDV